MKVTVVSASPHKRGNTAFLIEKVVKELDNFDINWFNLYDMKISGCRACYYCKKNPGCILQDEMQEIYRSIMESTLIIMGTPIYFSSETGPMKVFIDRLYAFVDGNRKPKITGKDFMFITVSGAPGTFYKPVADKIAGIFISFFKFNSIGVFSFGGMKRSLSANEQKASITQLQDAIREYRKSNGS